MHAYRFRILAEEQDDFVRDIEVLANQTFEDLHHYLVGLFEFDGKELASFSICNGKWHKISEITLIDMKLEDGDLEDFEDDKPAASKQKLKTYLMASSKIRDFIEDPHQRIIYEYDFLRQRTFFLELSKILTAEEGLRYPRCVKSEGTLPKANTTPVVPADIDEDELDLVGDIFTDGKDFEDDLDDTFVNNLDDGFEIEEDQSMDMNISESFDAGYEEGKG